MAIELARADAYLEAHLDETLAELGRLCARPNAAAQGLGMAECAALTATMLREHGLEAEPLPSDGLPVVLGELAGASEKPLLFSNHYDVQPAEPLELWDSPRSRRPGATARSTRGVGDDKGHIVSRLAAIRAILAMYDTLPCCVTFIIEGEEEIGSNKLTAFVRQHRERLRADGRIWKFGGSTTTVAPSPISGCVATSPSNSRSRR